MKWMRTLRALGLAITLAAGPLVGQRDVHAASCDDINYNYGAYSVDFVYCGPFSYEGDVLDWMEGVADSWCQGLSLPGAYYYWHSRVTPFEEDAYYDGHYECGF